MRVCDLLVGEDRVGHLRVGSAAHLLLLHSLALTLTIISSS